jgi:hypothetical protein
MPLSEETRQTTGVPPGSLPPSKSKFAADHDELESVFTLGGIRTPAEADRESIEFRTWSRAEMAPVEG